jgi:hypothetical protein
MPPHPNARAHLLDELHRLDRMIHRQVLRMRAARLLDDDEFRGLYIPDALVDNLLGNRPGAEDSPRVAELSRAIAASALESERWAQSAPEFPLNRLVRIFGLTGFARDVVLIVAAPELDLRYQTLYAYVQNDVTRRRPTVDLALKLLCTDLGEQLDRRSAFSPAEPLFHHQLLRLLEDPQDREAPLGARVLKAEPRVVEFLLEVDRIDDALAGFTTHVRPATGPDQPPLSAELRARLGFAAQALADAPGVLLLRGDHGAGKREAAGAVCASLGRPMLAVDLEAAVLSGLPADRFIVLVRREALLRGAAVYLSGWHALTGENPGADLRWRPARLWHELGSMGLPVVIGNESTWQPPAGGPVRSFDFELPLPSIADRIPLWQRACNGQSPPGRDLEVLAGTFTLTPGQISDAARAAGRLALLRPPGERRPTISDLREAARTQAAGGLPRLAQKVEASFAWDDLVLPARSLQQLREICAGVRHRATVHARWGFEEKLRLGRGLNVLFQGPSGTGKTMAASILASELALELYKIDLSTVVSKYIGETEKNLSSIFREAQRSGAILLFDEADALFGKRSEVKDAHDRYANIEVAYLLQKMEEFAGIAILATNLNKNIDQAFVRRMHHIVEFPFPSAAYREPIWRSVFSSQAPVADDLDFDFLARQFELAGGNIRNAALGAAFLAAEDGGPIAMEHVVLAVAREIQKLGKLPSRSEFAGYYELIRNRGG